METAPTVLIADDEATVGELLQQVLERIGLRVERVRDGVEALKRLAQGSVDLLVCDLDMPRMDGHGVLAELARVSAAPSVFVISGYLDPREEERVRGYPFVRAIYEKPFDVLEFAEASRRCAEGRGRPAP
jgi:CheY-like chemotaxis protein